MEPRIAGIAHSNAYFSNASGLSFQFHIENAGKDLLGIKLTRRLSDGTEFEFWPYLTGKTFEPVEPDVVIHTSLHEIVVECKFGSDFYEDQLEREIAAGKNLCSKAGKSKLILLAVSDHLSEPETIEQLKRNKRHEGVVIKWIS